MQFQEIIVEIVMKKKINVVYEFAVLQLKILSRTYYLYIKLL